MQSSIGTTSRGYKKQEDKKEERFRRILIKTQKLRKRKSVVLKT